MSTNPDENISGFHDEKKVNIIGYPGDVRDPFITKDDKYLFFDDYNQKGFMSIFYAEKIDDITFNFIGELPRIGNEHSDFCPTMDSLNNFYFISRRDLETTKNATIFTGSFSNNIVDNVRHVSGTIISPDTLDVNFDVNISYDGKRLLATSVMFDESYFEYDTDLILAFKSGDLFNLAENTDEIFKNINTSEFNECYAELSKDGLELFFIRYNLQGLFKARMFYAKREKTSLPFAEASLISIPVENDSLVNISSPSLSGDGKRLYYQKGQFRKYYNVYMMSRE